ncbi:hypothetical protein [Vibrio sp. ABG19]|uniref:hypothetical protein n=1 Tax=Vibrio sp. ABG19 TaxID=2817385 RepID=UPI00249DA792|nr:hypothetical protein [Vibrio sp. ABG19]WGY45255.1 hypothetical protein J0X00_06065 [Vibrio sp. ABG19]
MYDVSLEQIRNELNKLVQEEREGVAHSVDYSDLQTAIEATAKRLFTEINEFAELDQDTFEQQESEYPDMLTGAKVGDLVWGESECWVSESIISDWTTEADDSLNDEYSNDLDDIARYVQFSLILGVLSAANSTGGSHHE